MPPPKRRGQLKENQTISLFISYNISRIVFAFFFAFERERKEVSEYLGISMDALRNWEMNGLLTVKRKENGYRIYTDDDIKRKLS